MSELEEEEFRLDDVQALTHSLLHLGTIYSKYSKDDSDR